MNENLLLEKYLIKNFPTYRLKHNMQFKRVVVFDNQRFLLSDEKSRNNLYFKLLDTLIYLFAFEKKVIETTLKSFLNVK